MKLLKKLAVLLMVLMMMSACSSGSSSGSRPARAKTGSKEIDTLRLQFVPSRPAEEIITATSGLGDLLIEYMAKEGYTINNVEITVSDSYEAAGEALSAGSVDIAWLPGGTYALYSNETDVVLTATRDAVSVDSSDPADWNKEPIGRVAGQPVTYYKGLIYASTTENGKKLAEKVNNGEKLTWEDLTSCSWGVRDVTSSAGYIYPLIWLMNNFDGKTITDLQNDGANVLTISYAEEFQQAAAEQIDIFVCYADGRNDYEEKWQSEWGRKDTIWEGVQVIGVTENIYNDTVSVTMANEDIYNEEFIAAFQNAMINLSATDEGQDIIAIYTHTGYEKAVDSDYDVSRQAQELLESLSK